MSLKVNASAEPNRLEDEQDRLVAVIELQVPNYANGDSTVQVVTIAPGPSEADEIAEGDAERAAEGG